MPAAATAGTAGTAAAAGAAATFVFAIAAPATAAIVAFAASATASALAIAAAGTTPGMGCDCVDAAGKLCAGREGSALSGGSSYLSPEELDRQLERWRPEAGTVRLQEFERALLQGRLTIVGGYLTLFGIQALVLAVFVLGPLVERLS